MQDSNSNSNSNSNTMPQSQSWFEHLSLGRVLSRTLNLFVDRYQLFMTLSAMVWIPAAIVGWMVGLILIVSVLSAARQAVQTMDDSSDSSNSDDNFWKLMQVVMQHAGVVTTAIVVQVVLTTAITLVGQYGMVRACANVYVGQVQDWRTCLELGQQHLKTTVLTYAIPMGAVIGGFVILCLFLGLAVARPTAFLILLALVVIVAVVVACVYVAMSLVLVLPVLVVEANNKTPMDVLRRSHELSQGRRCYLACPLFLLYVLRWIVEQILHNLLSGSNHPLASVLQPGAIVVAKLPDVLFMPLCAILTMVLYISIRADQEGLTQDVLQRELVQPLAYTAPTGSNGAPNLDYRQVALVEEGDDDDHDLSLQPSSQQQQQQHPYPPSNNIDLQGDDESVVVQGTISEFA